MTTVQPDQAFSRTAIARYWTEVRVSMVEIFRISRMEAVRRVNALRAVQDQQASSADYHIDPLRVAADLAGASLNTSHIRQYLRRSAAKAAPARQIITPNDMEIDKPRLSRKFAVKSASGKRPRNANPDESPIQHRFTGAKAL